jgi:transposase-like protein
VPTAGEDYPGSFGELSAWFPDDRSCIDYLEWLRWPDGFRCPRCVSQTGWRLSSGRWECTVCGRQTSVTAGTIFHRTRTLLPTWFAAAWLMTSQKQGVSALGLQRALGLGSYQTAWAMLHRFRLAMVRPGRERLEGWVEVDEAYVGGSRVLCTGAKRPRSRLSRSPLRSSSPRVSGGSGRGRFPTSRKTA